MKPSLGKTVPVRLLLARLDRVKAELTAVLDGELVAVHEIRRLIDDAAELARVCARFQGEPGTVN